MKHRATWTKDGYTLRSAEYSDLDRYYNENYCPLDAEVVRLTGCKSQFTKDEVACLFKASVEEDDRYLFLLLAPDGRIIGESVLNEMDKTLRSANFRIAIFPPEARGVGLGTWVIDKTLSFAFETLKLHRVELDVFSFNPRAEKAYLKAGFRHEGVLRDAATDGDTSADVILMAIREDEWKERQARPDGAKGKTRY